MKDPEDLGAPGWIMYMLVCFFLALCVFLVVDSQTQYFRVH